MIQSTRNFSCFKFLRISVTFPFLIIRILFACLVVYCVGGDCEVRNPVSVCVRVCLSCGFFVGAMLIVCVAVWCVETEKGVPLPNS